VDKKGEGKYFLENERKGLEFVSRAKSFVQRGPAADPKSAAPSLLQTEGENLAGELGGGIAFRAGEYPSGGEMESADIFGKNAGRSK